MGDDLLKVVWLIKATAGPELDPLSHCPRIVSGSPPSPVPSQAEDRPRLEGDSADLPHGPKLSLHLTEPQFLHLCSRQENTLPQTM